LPRVLTQTLLTLMIIAGSAVADRSRDLAGAGGDRITAAARWFDGRGREARYAAEERAVTNWRVEAATALDPAPVAALAALVDADRPVVTRCVRLNNYWCIKSARWAGEIGTDDEGHVGFASAERGADAAATLLRRYYLEFGRKSALAIVRRWAPAECYFPSPGGSPVAGATAAAAAGPITLANIAVRGIGATLRARYLASRRKGRVAANRPRPAAGPRAPAPRLSAVMPRALPAPRVPAVAAGAGDGPRLTISSSLPYRMTPRRSTGSRAAPVRVAAAPAAAATDAALPAPAPRLTCAPDEQRLRNYANRIVDGLGIGPDDDLKLFEADGAPTGNLAPVLLAMSGFELGTLRARNDLVDGAVERQSARARALATAEEAGGER
jgi:hypothetical protein